MILQILDIDCLSLLTDKACVNTCLNKYKNYADNSWVREICGKNPFIDTKYSDLPDIEFDMSSDKPIETDFENVKRVYEALRFLSDSNASEERLWASLCLGIGYSYVRYRWPTQSPENVIQHYYFGFGNRRSLTRNAIARLWWIGRLTYDKNREDPYELTRFVCSNADYIMHFIERNTSNNICVLRPFIEAIIDAQEKGYNINTDDAGELSKYLNQLGGMYILDFMSEEWIKAKISKRIETIVRKGEITNEEIVGGENKKSVDSKSKIVLQSDSGQKILIAASKNKFRTNPSSLIGLKPGDTVKIGKQTYHITTIK